MIKQRISLLKSKRGNKALLIFFVENEFFINRERKKKGSLCKYCVMCFFIKKKENAEKLLFE
jgi:hypothetical protein